MKSTKRVTKVKDIGEVITGKTPPTKNGALFGDSYPFITPSDINDYQTRYLQATERGLSDEGYQFQERYLLPKDSVCYVCIGSTIGKICMTSTDSFTNQQINSIKVNREKFNPYYVFYLFRYITPQIKAITGGSGSGKAILNKSSFENLDVEVHNFEYQNKIASILSAYDDLIENNTRRVKILEEMAQAIYREWFVNFRLPAVAGAPGIKLRKTTPEEKKAIGKDVIPEGWEVVRLGDVVEFNIGGGWGNSESDDKYITGAYVIRGTDIPGGKYLDLTNCPYRFHKESNFKSRELRIGDIVFEVSGGSKDQPLGRALLIHDKILKSLNYKAICASFCKLIRVNNEVMSPEYFYIHLQELYANRYIEKYQVQSTGISNFKFNYFLNDHKIILPNKEVMIKFNTIVEEIYNMVGVLVS